jgi:SSS family solute:Na+ symporter
MGFPFHYSVIGLAAFALIYSVYGGLKAVAWTDVIQVFFLLVGGLFATVLGLSLVGGGDSWQGFLILRDKAPDHFHMIFEPGQMAIPDGGGGTRDAYMDLPGLSVLLGGMWIANLSYWGCNQYITQRALAAKNLGEAQRGILFAAFLKLLMPLVVVIPGIAAYLIVQNEAGVGQFTTAMTDPASGLIKSDRAYPTLLSLLPQGVKGIAFAALVAAIVSSLASIANSTATIFTIDIYRNYINKSASERKLVSIGRIVAVLAFAIAVAVAPLLGTLDQAFQFIQEYTGFVSPGVVAIFLVGFFWKKASATSALLAAIVTIPLSAAMKFLTPNLPFIDRMGIAFLILVLLMVIISLKWPFEKEPEDFSAARASHETGLDYKVGAVIVCGLLAALYAIFW